jgi:ADP-ribose pyrophosphatase YjhB (NUDIX family)
MVISMPHAAERGGRSCVPAPDKDVPVTVRQAARLLVVDSDRNVLLFKYEDEERSWWATPGGGLESGDTFQQAAAREAIEELALEPAMLEPLWQQTVMFRFRGAEIIQLEQYFLMRVSRDDVALDAAVRDAHVREGIVSARWWSLEEMGRHGSRSFRKVSTIGWSACRRADPTGPYSTLRGGPVRITMKFTRWRTGVREGRAAALC